MIVLVDTSAWVDYFRGGEPNQLRDWILEGRVVCHPFIMGELVLGGLPARPAALLGALRFLPVLEHEMVLGFAREAGLGGAGIGWVDAHLLSAALAGNARLLTFDRALAKVARRHGCLARL